jgi:hypothetical protein
MKKALLLLIFCTPFLSLWGQKHDIFDVFYDESTAIEQVIDNDTLWLAGNGFLAKLQLPDGKKIQSWKIPTKLSQIEDIAVQAGGAKVALALREQGVLLHEGNQWRLFTNKEILGDSVVDPIFLNVGIDGLGRVWVFGYDDKKFIIKFENNKWIKLEITQPLSDNIKFFNDKEGNIHWRSKFFIEGFIGESIKTIVKLPSNIEICGAGFDQNNVLHVFSSDYFLRKFDQLGTVLYSAKINIGPNNGFCNDRRFSVSKTGESVIITTQKITRVKPNGETEQKNIVQDQSPAPLPKTISTDNFGNVWYISRSYYAWLRKISNDGVSTDAPYFSFISDEFGANNPTIDAGSEYIWMDGLDRVFRVNLLDQAKSHTFKLNGGIQSFAPADQEGQMWIGTNNGLYLFDGQTIKKIEEPNINENFKGFQSIIKLSNGNILGYAYSYQNVKFKIYRPGNNTWGYDMIDKAKFPKTLDFRYWQDGFGRTFINDKHNVIIHENDKWSTIKIDLAPTPFPISLVTTTPDDRIWITRADTVFFHKDNKWLKSAIADAFITDLHTDHKGRLWAAHQNGIMMFDGLKWHVFNSDNTNLPPNIILFKISEDAHGDLWITSSPEPMVRMRTKELPYIIKKNGTLSIWPNPSHDGFDVLIPNKEDGLIELMDSQGRVLYNQKVIGGNEIAAIKRGSVPNGIYFVRFITYFGSVFTQKVVFF